MVKITIRVRVYAALILIALLGFAYLTYWNILGIREHSLRTTEESLVEWSTILAEIFGKDIIQNPDTNNIHNLQKIFEAIYAQELSVFVHGVHKDIINNRVYVTDAQGKVVFDSYGDAEIGKDYSQWNDVYLTLRNTYGSRFSTQDPVDIGSPYMTVGAPIRDQDKIIGVLSVGKPIDSINQYVINSRMRIVIVAGFTFLFVILLGFLFSHWVSKPIEKLTQYARNIAQGNKESLQPLGKGILYGQSEIDIMAEAIDEMRLSLEGRKYLENYIETFVHALLSPLSNIRSLADQLSRNLENPNLIENSHAIDKEVMYMQQVSDDLMNLVHLECQQTLENPETLVIADLIQEIIALSQPACTGKQITLRQKEIDKALINGDRSMLLKALNNLIDNSLDFTPQGGTIEVSSKIEKNSISIIIEDTGTGIPDYALDKIYDRYYSLNRPDTQKSSTGIGLSYVKEALLLHHGTITITNRSTKGTRAVLSIPIFKSSNPHPHLKSSHKTVKPANIPEEKNVTNENSHC